MTTEYLEKLSNSFPKELIVDFYINKNYSISQCAKELKISRNTLSALISYYNIVKDETLIKQSNKITRLLKYGNVSYNNRDKARNTCLEKYGVDNVSKIKEFQEKGYQTKCENNGIDNPNNWRKGFETRIEHFGSLEKSYQQCTETREHTCLEKYGVKNTSSLESIKEKIADSVKHTFLEKYGVENYWLTDNAKRSNGSVNSQPNLRFKAILDNNRISYLQEYKIGNYYYDFRIVNTNYLVEINPTITHNIDISPFKEDGGIDKDYHLKKTLNAKQNGFTCINVWDWDDINKVIDLLSSKTKIFARKCTIQLVDKKTIDSFLCQYHLQGTCKNQSICLGLYFNDELIQVMTFGKPRYNKNFEYELLRLCTKGGYLVVGGAERLFTFFTKTYNPKSVISYCDNSKFSGNVYKRLGLIENSTVSPSIHWYNYKLHKHITDNLLRQMGFDRLFGDIYGRYGKGTDNSQLMLDNGFIRVFDSGQSVYTYRK